MFLVVALTLAFVSVGACLAFVVGCVIVRVCRYEIACDPDIAE